MSCPIDHASSQPIDTLSSQPIESRPSQLISSSNSCAFAGKDEDTRNRMPVSPEQEAMPGQSQLDTVREASTIPMENGKVWVYPSQQMFYNAMKRKQWDPKAQDMHSVVSIHNAVNEEAWRKILEWESCQPGKCAPKLLKFEGKPSSYSPKALFWALFGYKLPFDRHDWLVDRCGTSVTYVIDFYSGTPHPTKPVSMYLDVRPALSFNGISDRVRKWWKTGSGLY